MPPLSTATELRSFNPSGYEILDQDLAHRRELTIWSVHPLKPELGELYTVESGGRVHEVAVSELVTFRGGWSALCRVTEDF